MKKLLFLIAFVISAFTAKAQEEVDSVFYVTTETLPNSSILSSHTAKGVLSVRAVEAKASAFNVIFENETSWNASMKRSVIYASRLWEEQLQTCYPQIKLKMVLSNINTNLCSTEVAYLTCKHTIYSDDFSTSALLKYWQINSPQYLHNMGSYDDELATLRDITDITVNLNSQMINKYYFGTDGNTPSDKYDLVTLILREIAKGLGLNSTIIHNESNENNVSQLLGYSNHTIDPAVWSYLKTYLRWETPVFVGVRSDSPSYILNTNANLIDYDETIIYPTTLRNGVYEYTTTQSMNIRKVIGRYYDQSAEGRNFDGAYNASEWRIDLLRKDGRFITIKRSGDWYSNFSFNPQQDIQNSEGWARDSDGNIRGRVFNGNAYHKEYRYTTIFIDHMPETPELTGKSHSKSVPAPPDPNKPHVVGREIIEIHTLSFNAIGATSIEIKHESNDGIKYYNVNPDIDKFAIEDINRSSDHYYSITAINKNGQKIGNTIKFDATLVLQDFSIQISNETLRVRISNKFDANSTITSYTITNISNPAYVLSGTGNGEATMEVSIESLIPGVYSLSVVDNNGNQNATKFIKR